MPGKNSIGAPLWASARSCSLPWTPPPSRGKCDAFGLRDLFEATYSGVLDKREVIHRILETHGLDPARDRLRR